MTAPEVAAGRVDQRVQVAVVSPVPSLLGELLEQMIGRTDDCSACHFAGHSVEAASLAEVPPDVVVLEASMSEQCSAAALACRRRWPSARLLLLVTDAGPWCSRLTAELDAAGWITCHHGGEELLAAIRTVARTGRLRHTVAGSPPSRRPQQSTDRLLLDLLSGRERQVLQLLAAANSLEDIAEKLGITPNTVRTHVQNVITKLGVNSRLEAVLLAQRAGTINARQLLDLREHTTTAREPAAAAATGTRPAPES